MRRNHCVSSRCSTGAPERQPLAVDDLLVGEHGHVDRVPVHLGLLAVDEPGGKEIEEQPLLVLVVAGSQVAISRDQSSDSPMLCSCPRMVAMF